MCSDETVLRIIEVGVKHTWDIAPHKPVIIRWEGNPNVMVSVLT